jgi:hypothetical protein
MPKDDNRGANEWSPGRKRFAHFGVYDDDIEQSLCEKYINSEPTEKEWDRICSEATLKDEPRCSLCDKYAVKKTEPRLCSKHYQQMRRKIKLDALSTVNMAV